MEELRSKQSPEVVELIEGIAKARGVDPDKHLDLSCDLFDLAYECGNDDLKSFASCTLGDACCKNGDFSQGLYYLSAGVQAVSKTDEYQLICRCYNELGVIFRSESHFITAEEYFINCIEIARANRLYKDEAVACSNFASLCYEMDAAFQALEYSYRAIECCTFIEDKDIKNTFLITNYAFIVRLYAVLGEAEKAAAAFAEMEKIVASQPAHNDNLTVLLARLHYFRFRQDDLNTQIMKKRCLETFYSCNDCILYYDETKAIISLMMEENDYAELDNMFTHIENIVSKQDCVELHLYIENCRTVIYETVGDDKKLMESLKHYRLYSEQKSEDSRRSFLATLRLRSELAQEKTQNLFLLAAAETDSLTGIANRLKMNAVVDELFEMANKEQKHLGVEMMDVDYFKEVNDTYGHSKGDELLVSLANVLKNITDNKIFVARYGGDEFVVFYYDMTDAEIIEKAEMIKASIKKASSKLGLQDVSVSQGIVNHVPRPLNRAWDYLNAADLTLYFVKNHGKDNVRLVHRATDLETQEWK